MDRRTLVKVLRGRSVFILIGLAASVHLFIFSQVHAFQFDFGEWQGSLDSTLSSETLTMTLA
ncbi:MAG: hypothetical protein JRJ15_15620 [Deltaproteobacteria bacterium]|nr:hypothetical protein [Deltaproteobacteria bacterium]